jgi:hypothetical protein
MGGMDLILPGDGQVDQCGKVGSPKVQEILAGFQEGSD